MGEEAQNISNIIIQNSPSEQNPPLTPTIVEKEVKEIFYEIKGYTVPFNSYGKKIIGLILVGLLISFSLYLTIWTLLDNATGLANRNWINVFTSFEFWFGLVILSFPTLLYAFSFSTYLSMLYDSRLSDIVKILTTNSIISESFLKLHLSKFGVITERIKEFRKSESTISRIRTIRYLKNNMPIGNFYSSLHIPHKYRKREYKYILNEAFKIKSGILIDLLQTLSVKLDGVTIHGYILPLLLLQIIVAAAFVFPSVEFARLGTIGMNMLVKPQSNEIGDYISFWAMEWAIFGAFVYSFISLMERIPRKDVTPRFYLNIALRYIFAIALSALFFLIFQQTNSSIEMKPFSLGVVAAISFTIGMFPNRYFRTIASFVDTHISRSSIKDVPLERLLGISANEATRLWEEGIDNVDQLAKASVLTLYLKTRFDPNRLKDLIGEAILWKYLFGTGELLMALGIEKSKNYDLAHIKEKFKLIYSLGIPNIQSLCTLIFLKEFETIDENEIQSKEINERLSKLAGDLRVKEYRLLQIALNTLLFKKQLIFVETAKEISDLLKEMTKNE